MQACTLAILITWSHANVQKAWLPLRNIWPKIKLRRYQTELSGASGAGSSGIEAVPGVMALYSASIPRQLTGAIRATIIHGGGEGGGGESLRTDSQQSQGR